MERDLKTPESAHPGRWWHAIEGERIQCDLCPRDCKLHEGQRGACFVRRNVGHQMVLTTYGRSSGFCIDPIEKKPLNHFYPGSAVLSFGTAGCNLACKFCQNWDISKSKDMDRLMDAANVDLKAFTDEFYIKLCGGHLQPILDTLSYIHHETSCWLEITTLLIPGKNDSAAEIKALAEWVAQELGPDVPLHFSAFHPDWKLDNLPPTPASTLTHARSIAMAAGLHYVYTGNVHDTEGGTTFCPACEAALIERDWYNIRHYDLPADGCCPHCRMPIAGRFGRFGKPFGSQRIPVRLARP